MEDKNGKIILLTGCTGALGSFILKRLLNETKATIFLLVRRNKDPYNRIKILLTDFLKINPDDHRFNKRLRVLIGDITKDNLGLNKKDYKFFSQKLSHIYHCAALTNLKSTLAEVYLPNVIGTANIIKLANNASQFKSLNYISSMFIAGNYKGEYDEKSFWVKQKFNNAYEESKFRAEELIRKNFNSKYNSLIYRPSVIMGATPNGAIIGTSTLYLIVYFFNKGIFDKVPLSVTTRHNLVPVDHAAKAIFLLSKYEEGNAVYNICSPRDILLTKFLEKAAISFNYKNPKFIPLVNYNFSNLTPSQLNILKPMISYLNYSTKFKAVETNNKLRDHGFKWSGINQTYYQRVFKYFSESGYIKT